MGLEHALARCKKTGPGHYHYKNWSYDFQCPSCGRTRRQSTNFLGQRGVYCDGRRTYLSGDTLGEIRRAGLTVNAVIMANEPHFAVVAP